MEIDEPTKNALRDKLLSKLLEPQPATESQVADLHEIVRARHHWLVATRCVCIPPPFFRALTLLRADCVRAGDDGGVVEINVMPCDIQVEHAGSADCYSNEGRVLFYCVRKDLLPEPILRNAVESADSGLCLVRLATGAYAEAPVAVVCVEDGDDTFDFPGRTLKMVAALAWADSVSVPAAEDYVHNVEDDENEPDYLCADYGVAETPPDELPS